MKNNSYLKFIRIFMIAMMAFTSCSSNDDSNDDPNPPDNSLLTGKWWYDTDNFTADVYFHSDGMYEQKLVLLGNELTSTGDWAWENESEGIVKVSNLGCQAQTVSQIWIKVSDLMDETMTIKQSVDGTAYSAARFYSTTNPE